jgi:ABC-type phosphate/phosphonate transport system ATPase subunit
MTEVVFRVVVATLLVPDPDMVLADFEVKVFDQKNQGTVRHAIMRPNTTRAKVRAAQFFFW